MVALFPKRYLKFISPKKFQLIIVEKAKKNNHSQKIRLSAECGRSFFFGKGIIWKYESFGMKKDIIH